MTTKADHYAELLENARCEGNWDLVPELVRKVRKHTSSRTCLTLAAETESAISNVTTTATRPSATDTARDLDISNRLPKLERAIEEEGSDADDKFQARVCVGWLHWVVGNYDVALEQLPNLRSDDPKLDFSNLSSEWTHVCALKAAYLRANCLTRNGKRIEALTALESAAPVLKRVESGKFVRKQLRYWAELFLTEYCVRTAEAIENGQVSRQDASTLAPFRSWATFWDAMQAPVTGGLGFKGSVPRRQIWKDYYLALSHVLQNDLPYEPGLVRKIPGHLSTRAQLRSEIKYVEAVYQSLLLSETTFPRADEERTDVEAFAGQLMKNWSVLCGRGWREVDLGQGGRGAISCGVLETLYGAATKTFHSTTILRSLFLVHLSLAEFDLAFKAFDSYLEIIKKGKARMPKTGEAELSLDSDGTVLETMAQGVLALCRYGHQDAGEKARRVGADLEDWLSKLPQIRFPDNIYHSSIAEDVAKGETQPPVAPQIVALAWQAIGLSHAHWSRLTSEAGSRLEIQSKAIRCLRKSLASEFGRSKDLRSFFGLALLLAERRELTAAIELTRSALMSKKSQESGNSLLYGPYWQERSLIPLWHLLALLLSARQDYGMAFRACEGALDEFKDPTVLFGRAEESEFHNEHLNGTGSLSAVESCRGLVDDMDDSEKEGILEIKMTQLALIELTEGPEMAVNASHELLTLFTRLFSNVSSQTLEGRSPPPLPPRTAGTLRTIRGSLFGSHKQERSAPSTRQPSASIFSEKSAAAASRPSTSNSATTSTRPAIQVTSEGDGQAETPRSRRASSSHGPRSDSRRRSSVKKRNRSSSRPEIELAHQPTLVDGDLFFTPAQELDQLGSFALSKSSAAPRLPPSSRGKAASVSSYFAPSSRSGDYTELSVDVTHATPHLLPLIRFSKEKEKRQRMTILIRIWLTVGGFYRRAKMLEDCKAAISEAQKLVEGLETEWQRNELESGGGKTNSWAERRSVEDSWGDVWAELGLLALAQSEPYVARSDFEQALTYCPNHAAATVGLSNLLVDMYCEELHPSPVVAPLVDKHEEVQSQARPKAAGGDVRHSFTALPLGLGPPRPTAGPEPDEPEPGKMYDDQLPAPYKASRLPLVDRLAARDRAFTLLTGLTRLGSGWDDSDAWFALARAYEESGQLDKAKEVLWWCVELEEARGVRDWRCLAGGGYVI
ncbi:hypothetical protein XA68_15297 [Ophiocordyceps unilateralis]|uniref:Filamentation protein n=1 Tax=Ophiocordyceps unilateralis TaxID=268505 RepID=A0A2A9P8V8_OPHUN|nr:hypothetical protein XA68_15297 [Ophiocordyceps unilateralis]